jgi:hypothetical protein
MADSLAVACQTMLAKSLAVKDTRSAQQVGVLGEEGYLVGGEGRGDERVRQASISRRSRTHAAHSR